MGCGFTIAMLSIGIIRELLGNGTIFGITMLGSWYNPPLIMILPPGAFILIGYMIGAIQLYDQRKKEKLKGVRYNGSIFNLIYKRCSCK